MNTDRLNITVLLRHCFLLNVCKINVEQSIKKNVIQYFCFFDSFWFQDGSTLLPLGFDLHLHSILHALWQSDVTCNKNSAWVQHSHCILCDYILYWPYRVTSHTNHVWYIMPYIEHIFTSAIFVHISCFYFLFHLFVIIPLDSQELSYSWRPIEENIFRRCNEAFWHLE